MSLIDNKKEYFVKEGTCFFRLSTSTNLLPYMFFGFHAFAAHSSESQNRKMQVWKTKKNFKVLYAVKKYEFENQLNEYRISSLADIYLEKYPNTSNNIDYLTVKKVDNEIRRNLLNILKSENIFGWVTSVEDTNYMELFLFGDIVSQLIEFKGFTNNEIDRKLYDYDYFNKSNIV